MLTTRGIVTASAVIRATEGFSAQFPGVHRDVIPFYSLMIATEPLGEEVLQQIGLRSGETFGDLRHLIIYGQLTPEGTIAFGGRGAPYHFGSRIEPRFDTDRRIHAHVEDTLLELFPAFRGSRSRTAGAARLVSPVTGTLRSASIGRPASAGRAATSATVWRWQILLAARSQL